MYRDFVPNLAFLTGASPELAKMEAAFLATLFKVRQLGSEFDAKYETLKARRAARQQRSGPRMGTLRADATVLQAGLQAGRASFAELQHQLLVRIVASLAKLASPVVMRVCGFSALDRWSLRVRLP